MLTEEQVKEVGDEFRSALRSVSREGADVEGLIAHLEKEGFFEAPASTRYHCSFKGGLALHSLNVARELYKMLRADGEKVPNPEWEEGSGKPKEIVKTAYGKDSAAIVGLLHDVAKSSLYEPFAKNEKAYSDKGSKQDGLGRFDWVSTMSYRTKDPSLRDAVGGRGFAAYYAVSRFIPLTDEEAVALANQCSPGEEAQGNVSDVFARHNLAAYLHAADVVATYCVEHD